MKRILFPLLLAVFFGLGIWASYQFLNFAQPKAYSNIDSTVVLEKVEQVFKMVTVEGVFVERYDETNIKEFTFYLPLPSRFKFSKSAELEVRGRVLVGYDMGEIEIEADSLAKRILLSNFPQPKIIAIDHEVRYKNLDESWFNSFDEKDFTILNKNAKKVLEQQAVEQLLLEKAKEQGNQVIDAMAFMVNAAGWKLEIESIPDSIDYELLTN